MNTYKIEAVESITDATEPVIIECVDGNAYGPFAHLVEGIVRYDQSITECYLYADGTVDAFAL